MRLKRCLAAFLTMTMTFSTGAFDVMAAGTGAKAVGSNQVASAAETVYVDDYGTGERSVSFNNHWRFYLGELNGAEQPSYNDSSWENVTLPHDYSIDQGFTTAAPAEQESGYVLGGTGWYRKSFALGEDMQGKVIRVDFDGVYMNATVYLNGEQLGTHPYGYTPFSFVLPADKLNFGKGENTLAVKVDHKQPSSRFYTGSGIYRDVNLTITDPVHVSYFGTAVTTPDIKEGKGTVKVVTSVKNDSAAAKDVSVRQTVYEKGSETSVTSMEPTAAQPVAAGAEAKIEASVTVPSPKLWSTEAPNLYTVRTEVLVGDTVTDTYDSDFGFRWVEFTLDNGFFLNGENMKLDGVCMHSDQGGLGMEAWRRSVERQVEILQQMGVNAIRVTHNPASQTLIDVCNEKGMLLVEEAFDSWLSDKAGNVYGYGTTGFDYAIEAGNQLVGAKAGEKWAEFDLKAMIKRGRNNPSIIMWSLGNEVFQQLIDGSRTGEYPAIAEQLIRWTAEEDATRYVTFGDNQFKGNEGGNSNPTNTARVFARANELGVPGGLPGYNYGSSGQIQNGHNQGWLVYGSESASSINSRGIYDTKSNGTFGGKREKSLTSYDKSCVGWGHLASDVIWTTERQDFNAGAFVWTGFDYIGEPTPDNWQGPGANGTWPNIAKNSYFGIIDTAGFPKDTYYLYQSQWNNRLNTLHVLPVWDEDEIIKDSGGKVEVVVYSDAPVVKLYLNEKEVGTATSTYNETPTGGYYTYTSGTGCFAAGSGHTSLYATFHVPYEAGKLEAKAFKADGTTEITETDGRSVVETAKASAKLTAKADRKTIAADGKDLSFITIDVTDTDGKFVNGAEPEITVSVEGDGKLLALDNGVQNDVTAYNEPTRKAGKGKLVAIVQSTEKAGSFKVKAQAKGHTSAEETVTTMEVSEKPAGKSVVSYELSRYYYVKEGTKPALPDTVKVNYADGTSAEKAVSWDTIPANPGMSYSVSGSAEGVSPQVYITTVQEVAAILNYSAAVGKGAGISLPASRPAIMADGAIMSAEFPVTWDVPQDVTETTGIKEIQGEADIFGEKMPVSASVRVISGGYRDGEEALPNVPEMYVNGTSSKDDAAASEVLAKLKDGKSSKEDIAWSGTGTLDFRLDTAIDLKDVTLYLKDTAPTSSTMKIYYSSDNATWKEAGCKVSNKREDGVTIRTFTPEETVSDVAFRVEFTKKATLTELKLNTRIPTFTVGGEAALAALKVGGHTADATALERGWFGVFEAGLDVDDFAVSGKDNASVTILPKDSENVVRILLESEDHSKRSVYEVRLGQSNIVSSDAEDASLDYTYSEMKLTAPSYHGAEPPSKANDGDTGSIWHSRWGDTGSGEKNLSGYPELRYLQIELGEAQVLNGLRYLPRSSDKNGIVLEYAIRVSDTALDDSAWNALEPVATGNWDTSVKWKLAEFKQPVSAKFVRLYGVKTSNNSGTESNEFMSAAEVRVRTEKTELYEGNTTVSFADEAAEYTYTGKEVKPEPTVVYTVQTGAEGVTLRKGKDYTLSYRNNTEPGRATVVVTGTGSYTGLLEKEFTIKPIDVSYTDYEPIRVTTGVGIEPALPGTVVVNTNVGQQVKEVEWDEVPAKRLERFGTFTVFGMVAEADNMEVWAEVTVADILGVQPVTLATVKGTAPVIPDRVTVYYSNGETGKSKVTWNMEGVSFDTAGTVKVPGIVGTTPTEASIRVEESLADANSTPVNKNLALNVNGANSTNSWPRLRAYISSSNDGVYNVADGNKNFVSDSTKKIWCDWQSGVYHTNADAAVGADDHLPFIFAAFGAEGSTNNDDIKKYTVNKVYVGFMEEDGSSAHKVRLPKDYKIEYYSENGGVFPAARLNNNSATECGNTKGWGADNPVKAHDGWTEVNYLAGKPLPDSGDFKYMVEVPFEAVQTSAIRITLTPQDENWTGMEEFEVYYAPENGDFDVTSIKVDGENVLSQFTDGVLNVDKASGVITAEATNNASVTVLRIVNGEAKVVILPENGDESKKKEYTVKFNQPKLAVTAESEHVEVTPGEASEGEEVSFKAKDGYIFTEAPTVEATAGTAGQEKISVRKKADSYIFEMPGYPVTIKGNPEAFSYTINTKIPARYLERTFRLPEQLNITMNGETFDTDVTWDAADVEALQNASEIGRMTLKGRVSRPEGLDVEFTVLVSPAGIIYFVDSGADEFTEDAKIMAEANKDSNRIKNADSTGAIVPDGAYSSKTGWGYTNAASDLEVNGTGDAYTSIRNFVGTVSGQTLSYRFDNLDAGTYSITAGFYDPWSQWAGDNRHAKVTVTDLEGNELAVKADHHISGDKTDVSFDEVVLEEAGSIILNVAPTKTGDNSDVMISYIVIQDPAVAKTDALNAAIDRTKGLKEADYTASSWAAMQQALQRAKLMAIDAGASQKDVNAATAALRDALSKLTNVDKAGLWDAIGRAAERNEADYTAESWAAMQAALASAQAVAEDADVTQAQVDAATYELSEALRQLKQVKATNKNALNVVIVRAANRNEADYTTESWAAMQAALKIAQELAADEDAGQAEVNAAAIALREAIANLVRKDGTKDPVDKTGLQAAIDRAEERKEADYTAESWAEMQTELAVAKTYLAKTDVTQEDIDIVTLALSEALRNLEEKPAVNKNALNAAIGRTEGLEEENYTASSWAAMQEALEMAQEVAAKEDATQEEVNAAAAALRKALENMVRVDKSGLYAAIGRAAERNEADYTAESWAEMQEALENAEAVAADRDAVQQEVDDATFALSEAIRNLKEKGKTPDVTDKDPDVTNKEPNKDGLEEAVKEAESKKQSDYTPESWDAFQKALAQVKEILSKEGVTQEEIDAAKAALQEAIKNLKTLQIVQPPKKVPAKNSTFDVGALQYKVTKSDAKGGTVSVSKLLNKKAKKIKIPATVEKDGYTFKVTEIAKNVFQKNAKITQVEIGANVSKIGAKSFFNCKKLGKITFKNKKAPKLGSKAFKGIKRNCKVTVPKKMSKKDFRKLQKKMKSAGKKISFKKK